MMNGHQALWEQPDVGHRPGPNPTSQHDVSISLCSTHTTHLCTVQSAHRILGHKTNASRSCGYRVSQMLRTLGTALSSSMCRSRTTWTSLWQCSSPNMYCSEFTTSYTPSYILFGNMPFSVLTERIRNKAHKFRKKLAKGRVPRCAK
jgi:hypothetical protein